MSGLSNKNQLPPMTGLEFLSAYSDDEDAEEHQPTDTSASSFRKRTRLDPTVMDNKLPVPDTLRHMFSTSRFPSSLEPKEDADEHQGRIRSFPHVRGNWASYAYINYSGNPGLKRIVEILTGWIKLVGNPPPSEMFINTEFHLSLSRTQIFKHHWIDQFLHSFNSKLKAYKPFVLDLNVIEVYMNEERTRTFLAIEAFPSVSLLRLVADCDRCLVDYDLLPYYEEPSFHVSFAWMVGDHEDWIRKYLLTFLNVKWEETCDEEPSFKKSLVDSIGFRTGNKSYVLPLTTNTDST